MRHQGSSSPYINGYYKLLDEIRDKLPHQEEFTNGEIILMALKIYESEVLKSYNNPPEKGFWLDDYRALAKDIRKYLK